MNGRKGHSKRAELEDLIQFTMDGMDGQSISSFSSTKSTKIHLNGEGKLVECGMEEGEKGVDNW
jgi:hypothetical protein